ncbi:MAG: hypothetical protein LBP91_02515 [Coriobacteriales bacterium]|jgi:hypothetical protein|nr:hypothetical protein [Coriobacteriales bacterium]
MSGYIPKHLRAHSEQPESELLASLPGETTALEQAGELVLSAPEDNETVITDSPAVLFQQATLAVETGEALLADSPAPGDAAPPLKPRKRRWPLIIAIILAAILAGGAAAYYILTAQALEREANRANGYVLLDEAISLIQESDQVVVALDVATATEVKENNLSERKVLLNRVPKTLETLSSAEDEARRAIDLFAADDDKVLAQHVIDAAVYRKDMLASSELIVSKDLEAMNSTILFGKAWEAIIYADSELRAIAELSNTGGYGELQEAITRNNAILTSLTGAAEVLAQAQDTFKEADYSLFANYLTLKIESIQLAIEADQALLDGDLDTVNVKNAEFLLKDAAVVEAATQLPPEPLTIITKAYDTVTADARTQFDSARAKVVVADRNIREYTGIETQTGVQ